LLLLGVKKIQIAFSLPLLIKRVFLYSTTMMHIMKMRNYFTLITIPVLLCACGAAKAGAPGDYYASREIAPQAAEMYRMSDAAVMGDYSENENSYDENLSIEAGNNSQARKLVKRAELRIRVEDTEATEKPLASLMEKYGAWSASAGIYENSRNYSIRVPSSSYDAMLVELAGLGKILRRTENAEDVTLRYYDLESRLATKRELLKTYQSYLGVAKNIEDIMTVESRIADLQRDIDQTGTQFRNLSNLVDYSTINLEIAGPVSASSYSSPTLGDKLRELFGSFSDVASSALVILMGIIVYGIPAMLILFLLFWILFGRIGLLKKLWRLVAGNK